VLNKKALTMKALLGHGLTSLDLKSLQPDVEQWIQSGKAYVEQWIQSGKA
jgi:hypothetical protein